ncbi:unnamed protein product [Calypogeia fissa]
MATVQGDPKPFLNNLTGKPVIVKLKWEVVRVQRWKNVLHLRRVPKEDDVKDVGKLFPRDEVPSRRRSEREVKKKLKVMDVDVPQTTFDALLHACMS